ncbi:hypothetical protein GCM10027176_78480 [Actinoallomurus bryophytorum]|uniref:CU044_5270 family protein n=1 Tax=Actinoallomurus bryophytorum TaxID=1490222 RepID=A0A543CFN2_9ACTN|nr:CU044_5270 family protein [Actinoallomurus bryophytorum]TQL95913.1 hypothetical protein FB559_1425 [Actinoallomurus bryophytorum]
MTPQHAKAGAEMDPSNTLAAEVGRMAEDAYRRRRNADIAHITAEARAPRHSDRKVTPVRHRRALLLLAGTAAVAIGLGATAYAVGGRTPRPAGPPQAAIENAAVVQELNRAASVVEKGHDVRPLPHQWLYVKTVFADSGPGTKAVRQPPLETWTRFDGRRFASMAHVLSPSRLNFITIDPSKEGDDRTPAQEYADLRAMPADPDALLAQIQHKVDTVDRPREVKLGAPWTDEDRDDWTFRHLTAILDTEVPVPHRLQAAVYRAAAKIPGVRTEQNVVDAMGRHGLAVGRESVRVGLLSQIILDPHSYRYLGTRTVVTRTVPWVRPTRSVRGYVGGGKHPGTRLMPPPSSAPPSDPVGNVQSKARAAYAVTDQAGRRS